MGSTLEYSFTQNYSESHIFQGCIIEWSVYIYYIIFYRSISALLDKYSMTKAMIGARGKAAANMTTKPYWAILAFISSIVVNFSPNLHLNGSVFWLTHVENTFVRTVQKLHYWYLLTCQNKKICYLWPQKSFRCFSTNSIRVLSTLFISSLTAILLQNITVIVCRKYLNMPIIGRKSRKNATWYPIASEHWPSLQSSKLSVLFVKMFGKSNLGTISIMRIRMLLLKKELKNTRAVRARSKSENRASC